MAMVGRQSAHIDENGSTGCELQCAGCQPREAPLRDKGTNVSQLTHRLDDSKHKGHQLLYELEPCSPLKPNPQAESTG